MPHPSAKQFLGIGKEVTRGTPVVASDFLPVRSFRGARQPTILEDESLRGSAAAHYSQTHGVMHNEFSIEGDVFLSSIGYLLKAVLGEESISGAGPSYTHLISLLNSGDFQPPSYTLVDNYVVACRSYPGSQVSEVGLSWEVDGLLSYSASALSLLDSTIVAPTPNYDALSPVPAWSSSLTIGGVGRPLRAGELTISRETAPIHTQENQQGPKHIWGDAVSVTGSFTFLMNDDVLHQQFLDNVQPIAVLTFTQGANSLAFTMSKFAWDDSTPDDGEPFMQDEMSWKALANPTDVGASGGLSPLKVALVNARSTVY